MRFAGLRSRVALVLALVIQPGGARAADPTADYTVSFEAIWSFENHPTNFPPNPHFSPLIGATHDGSVVFWTPAGIASDGIESMAETGQTGLLTSEINAVLPGAIDTDMLQSG